MSKEILLVVESVSHEKGVSKDVLFGAIESALAVATKKRYGEDAEFRVAICLLYTSPSPRDMRRSRMPSSA